MKKSKAKTIWIVLSSLVVVLLVATIVIIKNKADTDNNKALSTLRDDLHWNFVYGSRGKLEEINGFSFKDLTPTEKQKKDLQDSLSLLNKSNRLWPTKLKAKNIKKVESALNDAQSRSKYLSYTNEAVDLLKKTNLNELEAQNVLSELDSAISISPENFEAYFYKAEIYNQLNPNLYKKQIKDNVDLAEQKLGDEISLSRVYFSMLYFNVGEYDLSVQEASKMLAQMENSSNEPNTNWAKSQSYYWRARVYTIKKDYNNAEADILKALEIVPSDTEFLAQQTAIKMAKLNQ